MVRIVLLRGINVGGHRKVPMAELRDALVDAGFESVSTYIQSGNVIVEGGPVDDSAAATLVAHVIGDRFGVDDVGVIVRSHAGPRAGSGHFRLRRSRSATIRTIMPQHVHVVFLAEPPAPTRRASLHPDEFAPDRFILDIHDGTGRTPRGVRRRCREFEAHDRPHRTGARRPCHGRNLNTVDRLLELAAQ